MRDFERVKEKIEVRLDTPQVTLLALGGLIIVGGAFAGGYALGQRSGAQAESTTVAVSSQVPPPAAATAEEAAPLGEVAFQFPTTLKEKGQPRRQTAPKVTLSGMVLSDPEPPPSAKAVKPAAQARTAPTVQIPEERIPVESPKPKAPSVAVAALPPPPKAGRAAAEDAPGAKPAPTLSTPKVAVIPLPPPPKQGAAKAPEPPAKKPEPPAAQPQPVKIAEAPKAEDAPKAEAEDAPKPTKRAASKAEEQFTLQVKAAKDRVEADAFVASLKRQGYKPWIVLADIPGKGRYYRIRVGKFDSREEAQSFQRRYRRKTGAADGGFITKL